MSDLHLSWSRDDEGVITIYATDTTTGRIAEVADLWRRPIREQLGLRDAAAMTIQQHLAETLVENWNDPATHWTDNPADNPEAAA